MLRIGGLLVVTLALSISTKGQTRIPQFKDFPVKSEYAGKNAPVIITADGRMYRTRLREAAQEKPNFAGHYILAAWGCGAGCLMGAVIDANTGKVHWLPHTICCWNEIERDDGFSPIVFRLNSRLIVFTGLRNERDGDQGAHFYEFDETEFKFIRTIKSTATHSEIQPQRVAYYSFGRIGTQSYEQLGFQVNNGQRGEITYIYGTKETEIQATYLTHDQCNGSPCFMTRLPTNLTLQIIPKDYAIKVVSDDGRYSKVFGWEYIGPINGRGTFCDVCAEDEKEAMNILQKYFLR
jgi:hypothetical protein